METIPFSIVLVDDDPDACAIFQMMMDHYKWPVTIIRDGETAIEYLRDHAADVVIMDLFLPGVDGFRALDYIRQSALAPDCRVIATTAYYTNDTQQEVHRRGFDGYIAKPFVADEIIPYLRKIASQS